MHIMAQEIYIILWAYIIVVRNGETVNEEYCTLNQEKLVPKRIIEQNSINKHPMLTGLKD